MYRNSTWSTEGLTYVRHNDSHVECSSEHLTAFSVLVDVHGTPVQVRKYARVGYSRILTFAGIKFIKLRDSYWMCHFLVLFSYCSVYDPFIQVKCSSITY